MPSLHTSPSQLHTAPTIPPPSPAAAETVAEILAPIFAVAAESTSLIASRHPIVLKGVETEIPKFLLLGQRGGGVPIRLGVFAGFEAGQLEPVAILARLFLQLRTSSSLSRDYALIGYPVVNVRGFESEPVALADFESRFARDSAEADVQFFKSQLVQWSFDGLLTLRSDPTARGFHAVVRSEIIAREVVEPALAAAAVALPLATQAVRIRPGDRYSRAADVAHGRLSPAADVRPYPFEIELFIPRGPISDEQADGLFVAFTEILRLYRVLIAHGKDL